MMKIGLILVVVDRGWNDFRILAGFNLPNNNVYAVSLVKTEPELQYLDLDELKLSLDLFFELSVIIFM